MNQETAQDPVRGEDRLKRSPTFGKLAAALAKAQGEMENAEKDVKGNYGKYATLAATWNAIRQPLSKNEIAIYQRPLTVHGKLHMCTMLIHSSGEFLDDGELELIYDRSGGRITPMQAMGSAVTYARRYTLQAAIGIAPEDDDGQSAGAPQPPNQKQQDGFNATPGDSRRVNQPDPSQTKGQAPNALPSAARSANGNRPGVFQAAKLAEILGPKVGKAIGPGDEFDPGDYVLNFGETLGIKGKAIRDIPETKLREAMKWADTQTAGGKPAPAPVLEFKQYCRDFFISMGLPT